MMRKLETVLLGDAVLKFLDLLRKKFNHLTARSTDQMVMMFVVVMVLVIGLVVAKTNFSSQPGFSKQLKSAVNGRVPDRRILFLNEPVKILTCQVFLRFQKDLKDQITLTGPPETRLPDVLKKDLFFFFELCHASPSVT